MGHLVIPALWFRIHADAARLICSAQPLLADKASTADDPDDRKLLNEVLETAPLMLLNRPSLRCVRVCVQMQQLQLR